MFKHLYMELLRHIPSSIARVAVVGALALLFTASVYAFTEPTQAPPGGNTSAPFNVSVNAQTKQGSVTVNSAVTVPTLCLAGACRSLWPAESIGYWLMTNGNLTYTGGNNVGIGTANPTAPLEVQRDQNSASYLNVTNTTNGTAAQALLRLTAGSNQFILGDTSAAYTPVTIWDRASGSYVQTSGAGGLSFVSRNAAGIITFAAGGDSERVRIDSSGNVGIGTANPAYRLDVQGGQVNFGGGLCINGDCKTSWSDIGGNFWTDNATANALFVTNLGRRVGIGVTNPTAKFQLQDSQDNLIRMDRQGAANPTILRIGTDGAFVINNNAVDALKIYRSSLFSIGNVYSWSGVSGAMGVGFGELQKIVTDFPGVPVTGIGWYAATGQIGVLIPQNQIFGIYGADPAVPQTPTTAHFYVTGDILSPDQTWTAPMRTSSSGAGTASGHSIQWRWMGASSNGKIRLKVDDAGISEQFIVPTCSIGSGGRCDEAIEPPVNLNTSSDFDLRCPGNEVMRGLKWTSATGELSLICTR